MVSKKRIHYSFEDGIETLSLAITVCYHSTSLVMPIGGPRDGFFSPTLTLSETSRTGEKQVAQWATIAHHGASIMFGDTIIYDVQRQITLNLKQ